VDALIGAVLGDRGCNPDASEIVLAGFIARLRACAEMEKPPAAEAVGQELARPLLLFQSVRMTYGVGSQVKLEEAWRCRRAYNHIGSMPKGRARLCLQREDRGFSDHGLRFGHVYKFSQIDSSIRRHHFSLRLDVCLICLF
jgi:hypothetical protein